MADKPRVVKRRPRVTIDNNMLSSMANNNVYVKEFQFLSRLRGQKPEAAKKGCGGCQRTRTDSAIFNAAKQAIASMSAGKKLQLKELLNTDQIYISYKLASGKTEDRYF